LQLLCEGWNPTFQSTGTETDASDVESAWSSHSEDDTISGFPKVLGSNRDFIVAALLTEVGQSPSGFNPHQVLLDQASVDVRRDRGVLLAAVEAGTQQKSPDSIADLLGMKLENPPDIDEDFAVELVSKGGVGTFAALGEKFRKNQKVMMAAARKDPFSLVTPRGVTLQEMLEPPPGWRSETTVTSVHDVHAQMESLDETALADSLRVSPPIDVAVAAVKSNWKVLEYFSDSLKNNRKVVLAAIEANGLALEFASQELRMDRDIVLQAVKENIKAIDHISAEQEPQKWLLDHELWRTVARKAGTVLWSANSERPEMMIACEDPNILTGMQLVRGQKLSLVHMSTGAETLCDPSEPCASPGDADSIANRGTRRARMERRRSLEPLEPIDRRHKYKSSFAWV